MGCAVGCHDTLPTSTLKAFSFPWPPTLCLFLTSLLFPNPLMFSLRKQDAWSLICESGAQNFLRSRGHFLHSPVDGLEVSPLMKSTLWKDSGFRKTPLSPLLQNRVFVGRGWGFAGSHKKV